MISIAEDSCLRVLFFLWSSQEAESKKKLAEEKVWPSELQTWSNQSVYWFCYKNEVVYLVNYEQPVYIYTVPVVAILYKYFPRRDGASYL